MLRTIPSSIWIVGVCSALMNLSNIMVFSLAGIFSIKILGLSALTIGFIEGSLELTSWTTRLVAGCVSDHFRRRKLIIGIGYALSVFSRLFFALAPNAVLMITSRLSERIGNGLQAAPREALVGDLSPPHLKGGCFGLRQALGILGSTLGSVLAIVLLKGTNGDYYTVFWVATIPAAFALILLMGGVKDTPHPKDKDHTLTEFSTHLKEVQTVEKRYWLVILMTTIRMLVKEFCALGKPYWCFVLMSTIFMLGRYSEIFLTLQAEAFGLPLEWIPLIMTIYNLTQALLSYPAGSFSDKIDRRIFIAIGFIMLIAADCALGFANSLWLVILGVVLWGVQLGITQGVLLAMVADFVPVELRATGFGVFYLCSGISLFVSSSFSGLIVAHFGLSAMFLTKAVIGLIAFSSLILLKPLPRKTETQKA